MRFILTLFLVLISWLNSSSQDEYLSGLYFSSHEVIQDQRTSLNLNPNDPFTFHDGFSIEFDANFRKGDGFYGYIFRIIGDGNTNIDLVSNLASNSSNFWLVLKDKVLCSYKWTDIPKGGFDRWLKIRLEVDVRNSILSISINGKKLDAKISEISKLKQYNIVFGACRNVSFLNTDVSPMSLKDIRVFDRKEKLIRYWKLSKHSQNVVYDETSNAEAQVDNPKWNIDKHVNWQKIKNFTIDSIVGIAHDDKNGRVFFVDKKAVYVMSTKTYAIDTLKYSSGGPYTTQGKQIIFNPFTNELWSYNLLFGTKSEISKFNFSTRTWSNNLMVAKEPDYWHHNIFISPVDSTLTTLFGYGHYTYKGFMNKYSEKSKSWIQTDISKQIQPRYLSAFGMLNQNEALIFGGYGSKTGRQELSPEFYYDLYKFNLNDFSFRKIWTLDEPFLPFVPCESLIADEQNAQFYTLLYNRVNFSTYLHLASFKTDKPEYKLFNDSIPYNFLDIESWSTLLFDQKSLQLIAITKHKSEVSLYSIAYPPLLPEGVYQNIPQKGNLQIWLILTFLITAIFTGYYFLRQRKRNLILKHTGHEQLEHPNIVPIESINRSTISSVYFMGGFQIFNRAGQNITTLFSPTLKQLFLFIFLNTQKNGKGVTSKKLDEVLWFDKSGESARNNRNVNLSKLRSILDDVDGIEIVNDSLFWKVNLCEPLYCDYTVILKLLDKSKSAFLTEVEINQLIALFSIGEILPAVQTEWVDAFKSQFVNEMIDGLTSLFSLKEVKSNLSLRYHLSECILIADPFNDEAFAIKCSVLYHLGKKGLAKNMYDSFCREYKHALGIDYGVSFSETIQ